MDEAWATMFGSNAVTIRAGEIQIRPGLGRHQLVVPIEARPTAEAAYGRRLAFSGSLSVGSLRGSGGYIGHFHKTLPRQLAANGTINEYLHVDIDRRQIDAIENLRNGGFSIDVQIDIEADGGTEYGTVTIAEHVVARETWLRILEQIKFQRTLLVELPVPDTQAAPELATAIAFLESAQRRFLEGENRLAVEAVRQSMAALVGLDANSEDSDESIKLFMKKARGEESGFDDRYEIVRQALKLLADIAAHPDVAETGPTEARSAITMAAGLLQWYSNRIRPTAT